jgi:hypothetical protein
VKDSIQYLGTARSSIDVFLTRIEGSLNMTLHVEKEQSGIRKTMYVTTIGLYGGVTVGKEV